MTPQQSEDYIHMLEVYMETNSNSVESGEKHSETDLRELEFPLNLKLRKQLEVNFIEFESITETGYWFNSFGLRGLLFRYERETLLSVSSPKTNEIIGNIRFRLDPSRKIFTHRKLY